MILDTLGRGDVHAALHPGFREAFAFLRSLDAAALSPGRIEIAGDRLYAMVVDAEGKGQDGARLETHREYIDIQYQAVGTDCIGWAPAAGLPGEGYDADKDLEFHPARPESWATVAPGRFAVFFPEDAHAPLGGRGRLLKVVVKVRR